MKTEDFVEDLSMEVFEAVTKNVARINAESIDDELSNLPLKYSFYAGAYALVQKYLDAAKDDLLNTLAVTKKQIRAEYTGKYKLADKTLDSQAEEYSPVIQARKTITETQFKLSLVKGILSSLDIKNQMIIQLSANRRGEVKTFNNL